MKQQNDVKRLKTILARYDAAWKAGCEAVCYFLRLGCEVGWRDGYDGKWHRGIIMETKTRNVRINPINDPTNKSPYWLEAKHIDWIRNQRQGKIMKRLTEADVKFTIEIEPEEIDIAMDIDDENKKIVKRLELGDIWAWASVKITAHWHGLEGIEYLGCCSYEDEEDFKKNSGYYEDMKKQALEDLQNRLNDILEAAEKLLDDININPQTQFTSILEAAKKLPSLPEKNDR